MHTLHVQGIQTHSNAFNPIQSNPFQSIPFNTRTIFIEMISHFFISYPLTSVLLLSTRLSTCALGVASVVLLVVDMNNRWFLHGMVKMPG
jgi:hypothetical protein